MPYFSPSTVWLYCPSYFFTYTYTYTYTYRIYIYIYIYNIMYLIVLDYVIALRHFRSRFSQNFRPKTCCPFIPVWVNIELSQLSPKRLIFVVITSIFRIFLQNLLRYLFSYTWYMKSIILNTLANLWLVSPVLVMTEFEGHGPNLSISSPHISVSVYTINTTLITNKDYILLWSFAFSLSEV